MGRAPTRARPASPLARPARALANRERDRDGAASESESTPGPKQPCPGPGVPVNGTRPNSPPRRALALAGADWKPAANPEVAPRPSESLSGSAAGLLSARRRGALPVAASRRHCRPATVPHRLQLVTSILVLDLGQARELTAFAVFLRFEFTAAFRRFKEKPSLHKTTS